MITLLFVISVILLIIGIKIDEEGPMTAGGILSVVFGFALLFIIMITAHNYYVIPQTIATYQEENAVIEQKISDTVTKYMEYEKGIIYEVAPDEDVMSLVSLYPDLSSDELIKSEIEVYVSNNKEIKELKAEEAHRSLYKFLLYFGH